jgi:hypothetical protein
MVFYTDGQIKMHLIETLGYEFVHRMNCMRRGIKMEQEEIKKEVAKARNKKVSERKKSVHNKYVKTTNRDHECLDTIGEELRDLIIGHFGITLDIFLDRDGGKVQSSIFCYVCIDVMNIRNVNMIMKFTKRSRTNVRDISYKGKRMVMEGMYKDKLDSIRPQLKEIAERYSLVGCKFDTI